MMTLLKQELYKLFKGPRVLASLVFLLALNLLYLFEVKKMHAISATNFVKEQGGGFFIVLIVVVIYASNIITKEFANGTVKILLGRQYRRVAVFLSKIMTLIFYYLFLVFWNAVINSVIKLIAFRNTHFPSHLYSTVFHIFPGHCLTALIIISLALLIGTLFKSSNISVSVGIFMLFISNILGPYIDMLINKYHWIKFNPLNFMSTAQQYENSGLHHLTHLSLTFMTMGSILYGILFLVLAELVFEHKRV